MDISHLIDGLNDKQREAVAAPSQNMLVLAGAGSGKTRVLVHRIAWLTQVEGYSPASILAVTFTNKAAAEMRSRVEQLSEGRTFGMWLGTFHSLAHRLLRAHARDAKLPDDFQILDSEDQYRLIRRILRAMNIDEKQWPAKQFQWYINARKDEGQRPGDIGVSDNPNEQKHIEVYRAYQESCDRAGLVDFAELLLRAYELWKFNPALLAHYQQRFRYILVDEFQDTNTIQYAWLRLLQCPSNHMMIVGDDDQSIYGWRGAKIENIQDFGSNADDVVTIRLEQNYRSSANILKASNHLIEHNQGRLGKSLWTDDKDGEAISVYAAFNDVDEARFVVARVQQAVEQGLSLSDCAILYRNNAQSRVLEEALMQERVAYKIYGGQRFFERLEIKHALSYMRLISNSSDDASFERVVNTPTRGIGQRTIDIMRQVAREQQISMWQAGIKAAELGLLNARAAGAVARFRDLIAQLAEQTQHYDLHEQCDHVIKGSGLLAMFQAEKGEKGQARVENLEELVTAAQQFIAPEETEGMTPLIAFLSHAALEAGDNQAEADESAVQLMTLHSAKGLEFPVVFMVGVEEGMFPSQQSSEESGRLEEERRLCYVGMTRAMQKLYICHAESRRLYGKEVFHSRSRFIRELPSECLEEIRLTTSVSQPLTSDSRFSSIRESQAFGDTGFALGQRVQHPKFGFGVVLNYEGSGQQSRVQVQFEEAGSKWLVTAYARLESA
ncbi:DNA helicase II [Alginatibacterium sediminis]|uniref:DNA 3'-5' helicase n=1 Tax=Alginatibacterium sediminis TaxID=2164068 RepID=A0A420EN63_9ALTE|nr:DNA helicase II [Alginatibacterium sediminis]RKF22091.1 DNA helicase II [Alginatibacterium sediminis]